MMSTDDVVLKYFIAVNDTMSFSQYWNFKLFCSEYHLQRNRFRPTA